MNPLYAFSGNFHHDINNLRFEDNFHDGIHRDFDKFDKNIGDLKLDKKHLKNILDSKDDILRNFGNRTSCPDAWIMVKVSHTLLQKYFDDGSNYCVNPNNNYIH